MDQQQRPARAARIALNGQEALLPSHLEVQVLDISVSGVLLQSNQPIETGTRGRLRLTLSGAAFSADVEVRRASPLVGRGTEGGYGIGATFVAITREHQQFIERFMSQ